MGEVLVCIIANVILEESLGF